MVQKIIHMLVRKSGPTGHDTLKLGLDASNGRLFRKFLSSSKSLELWLNLLWMWSPQHIFTSCGMVLLYPLLSQVGGLCQRDPLSLYLFILCLERLSILLEEAVQDKTIHPVTFRGQIKMSHLFFADDIFLYSKVNITECHNLENILHKFYNCSSQIIST